jgi:hypothetical protein
MHMYVTVYIYGDYLYANPFPPQLPNCELTEEMRVKRNKHLRLVVGNTDLSRVGTILLLCHPQIAATLLVHTSNTTTTTISNTTTRLENVSVGSQILETNFPPKIRHHDNAFSCNGTEAPLETNLTAATAY